MAESNADDIDVWTERTNQLLDSLDIMKRCKKKLDDALPNAESVGSAMSGCSEEISATLRSAALFTNKTVQVFGKMKGSEPDDEYHDNCEEKIKKAFTETNKLLDAVHRRSAHLTDDVLRTRAVKYALAKWAEHPEFEENKESLIECEVCGGLQEKEQLETIADPNLELVGYGEDALARNLRLWCTPYGEEKENELAKSSAALFRFGRLYLHKASCATAGMLQKLSFIRCAALLHAARIRFEKLREVPGGFAETFQKFHTSMLKVSGAKGFEEYIVNAITEVGVLITTSRIAVQNDLNFFDKKRREKAAYSDDFELNFDSQKGRIDGAKALNENMTDNYVSLMQNIAERCQVLLGDPPVKFAIVGLGSMARREITLHSDFEHVILVEDGYHSENVLEYFRWFAVIFQVIIIGFGETIVPAVCVKSINNLYSDEKTEDCWFYDIFTPCGIAFDGMAPHACATPLGRQIFRNEDNGQIRELIKTPSEMLLYLCPNDDVHHGFNLKDLLSCTFFVFGTEQVYKDFLAQRKSILAFDDAHVIVKQHAERIIRNPNPQVRDGFFEVKRFAKLDTKAVYYRPFSVLIGSLGRIHKTNAIGTFEVLEELLQKEAINRTLFHKLSYAFAVICEMRVRSYSKVQTQRRVFEMETIKEMVGEESDWTIKDMMQYLQDSIQIHENAASNGSMSALRSFNDSYVADCPTNEVRKWYFCGKYEKAVEVGLENLWKWDVSGGEASSAFEFWLFKSYYEAGRPEEKRMYWDDMQRIYFRLTNSSNRANEKVLAECHCIMAEVYGAQKRFRDAYDATKKWLMFYLDTEKKAKYRHRLPAIYKSHLIAAQKDMQPSENETHKFLQTIFSQRNSECSSTLRCLRFMSSKMTREESEIEGGLLGLVGEISSQARVIAEPRFLLKIIWAYQVNSGQWRDATITANYMKEFPDISCNELEHSTSQGKKWQVKSAVCAAGEIWNVVKSAADASLDIFNSFAS